MATPEDPPPQAAAWTTLEGEVKGSTYDARWEQMAAEGRSVHGEADLVSTVLAELGASPGLVLDAGCGTGRVAIELARRGHRTVGIDRDTDLLATARDKAPGLTWVGADLCDAGSHVDPGTVDVAVAAGNVLIFVDRGTEPAVVGALARTLRPGGALLTGFQVRRGGYEPAELDRDAAAAGLELEARWATWDRAPWQGGGDYQVSLHLRRPSA